MAEVKPELVGQLNRIIEIQKRTVTRDSFGAEVEQFVTLAEVWAEKLSAKPAEKFVNESKRLVNLSTASFRINAPVMPGPGGIGVVPSPFSPDETMRVVDDNAVTWDIVGIIKNDRQYLTLQVGHVRS